jgi:hypothetical protein
VVSAAAPCDGSEVIALQWSEVAVNLVGYPSWLMDSRPMWTPGVRGQVKRLIPPRLTGSNLKRRVMWCSGTTALLVALGCALWLIAARPVSDIATALLVITFALCILLAVPFLRPHLVKLKLWKFITIGATTAGALTVGLLTLLQILHGGPSEGNPIPSSAPTPSMSRRGASVTPFDFHPVHTNPRPIQHRVDPDKVSNSASPGSRHPHVTSQHIEDHREIRPKNLSRFCV